jgi:hypothetical protein
MEWMRKRRKEDKDAHIGIKGQKKKKRRADEVLD